MATTVTYRLPFPPSVNCYWRRGGKFTYLTKQAREFRKRVHFSGVQKMGLPIKSSDVHLSVRVARIRIRGEDGPTGELSAPQLFLYSHHTDKYWPLSILDSVPATLPHQLEIVEDTRDPYEERGYSYTHRHGITPIKKTGSSS